MVDDRLTDTTSPSSDDGGDSTKGSYNTVRPQAEARPAQSFRTRLTLFFALTAVMTAVVLSIVLAITWEGQFQRYTRHNMERLAQATAEALAGAYEEDGTLTATSSTTTSGLTRTRIPRACLTGSSFPRTSLRTRARS